LTNEGYSGEAAKCEKWPKELYECDNQVLASSEKDCLDKAQSHQIACAKLPDPTEFRERFRDGQRKWFWDTLWKPDYFKSVFEALLSLEKGLTELESQYECFTSSESTLVSPVPAGSVKAGGTPRGRRSAREGPLRCSNSVGGV